MDKDNSSVESNSRKQRLLKDQVRLVKKKDNERFEIVQIKDSLSFEKGFFVVIRACQMLVQKNDGIILIGLAGPSGAGKTAFTDKIVSFMPDVAVISMDNYNDATRVIDGNFDDPRLTDYDTLLKNILDLKEGKTIEVPIYDLHYTVGVEKMVNVTKKNNQLHANMGLPIKLSFPPATGMSSVKDGCEGQGDSKFENRETYLQPGVNLEAKTNNVGPGGVAISKAQQMSMDNKIRFGSVPLDFNEPTVHYKSMTQENRKWSNGPFDPGGTGTKSGDMTREVDLFVWVVLKVHKNRFDVPFDPGGFGPKAKLEDEFSRRGGE